MKLYISLLCAMLLVPAYHTILAEQDADYATSENVKKYNPKKGSFELSDNQKTALAVGGAALGAIAAGTAAYGAYQYANADDLSTTSQGQNSNLRTEEQVRQDLESPERKELWGGFTPTVPPRSHGEYYENKLEKYDQWKQDQAAQGIYAPPL